MSTLRLGILGSTKGTDLIGLYDAIVEQRLKATIEVVLSDKPHALILERAEVRQVPSFFIDPAGLTREAYDEQLSQKLAAYDVDLVILIGYMRILSTPFVKQWENRLINVHPSLLPLYSGGMDKSVHRAVLEDGLTETGCTVHLVTDEVDKGPILVQKKCAVFKEDTEETLKARVQKLEVVALMEAVEQFSFLPHTGKRKKA